MKKKLTIIILFFSTLSLCQSYDITYNMVQKANVYNITTNVKCYLYGNKFSSVYEEDFELKKNTVIKKNDEGIVDDKEIISLNKNPIYFKDFIGKKVYYQDQIKFNEFNVIDVLDSIEWKIEKETKVILDYQCQKATCKYKGRDFVVFFTNEIPVNDGPWKLTGLPGLILEVNSDDKIASFEIKAEKIKIGNEKIVLSNIYEKTEKISFSEFKAIYKKKYEESLYKIINENGETRPMSIGFREYFILD